VILVDTTFIIDYLRKKREVATLLAQFSGEILHTTEINAFECYLELYANKRIYGSPSVMTQRRTRLEELLTDFISCPFSKKFRIYTQFKHDLL
jgi:predicted nucleic acid-binding protein